MVKIRKKSVACFAALNEFRFANRKSATLCRKAAFTRLVNALRSSLSFTSLRCRFRGFRLPDYSPSAFTLAEVLITLTILGVIAGMIIPNVVKNYKRTILKTQLKQAYSDLEQLNNAFNATHQGFNMCNFGSTPNYMHFKNLVNEIYKMNYIKIKEINAINAAFADGQQKQRDLEDFIKTNYKSLTNNDISPNFFRSSYLEDGKNRDWFFYSTNDREHIITIDINGVEKKPNRLGEDLFTFTISPETGELGLRCHAAQCGVCSIGGVGIGGSYSHSPNNGIGCTEYAFRDIHPSDSSKKYWTDFLNLPR